MTGANSNVLTPSVEETWGGGASVEQTLRGALQYCKRRLQRLPDDRARVMGHVVDPTEVRFQGISDSSLVEARLNAQQVAQRARRKLQSAHERARCKLDSDCSDNLLRPQRQRERNDLWYLEQPRDLAAGPPAPAATTPVQTVRVTAEQRDFQAAFQELSISGRELLKSESPKTEPVHSSEANVCGSRGV